MEIPLVSLIFDTVSRETLCIGCGKPFTPGRRGQTRCSAHCGRVRRAQPVKFVAIDGESVNGKYCLLGCGDQQIEANGRRLEWKECFEFLYSEFQRLGRGHAFIGFYLGYDFTQILASLPENRAWYLLSREGQAKRRHKIPGKEPHAVEYDGWQFDLLANKRLRIRPKLCNCTIVSCKCKKSPWMYICDVGGFWQTSFLNVINPKQWESGFIDQGHYDLIARNKGIRSALALDDETRYYNRLENFYLAKCMSEVSKGFEAIGVHLSPKQWFGPGQAAQAWLKDYAPRREQWEANCPEWAIEAGRCAYYGGWFEVFAHGFIPGWTFEYDINSAYPSVIAKLPCLLHGKWHRGKGLPPKERSGDSICLVYGQFQSPGSLRGASFSRVRTGPLPYRSADGNISRPAIVRGWYYLSEVESSIRAGLCRRLRDCTIEEWVSYEACSCDPPFADIANLYLKRLEVGKNTVLGKGSKLVYNSAYGKFAQSIGHPMFGNALYASLITMGCRKIVLDAIASHPDKADAVLMVATDAVFFRTPHPNLGLSDRLGEWDCTKRQNLTIFKPGVYWDDETRRQIQEANKPKFKARGIDANAFAQELWKVDAQFRSEWATSEIREWPDVLYFSDFSIVSATQALAWGKWHLAGTERDAESLQSSSPHTKRGLLYYDAVSGVYRTKVKIPEFDYESMSYVCETHPYQKRFGTEDPFSNESREALGITPDGMVSDMFRVLTKNEE